MVADDFWTLLGHQFVQAKVGLEIAGHKRSQFFCVIIRTIGSKYQIGQVVAERGWTTGASALSLCLSLRSVALSYFHSLRPSIILNWDCPLVIFVRTPSPISHLQGLETHYPLLPDPSTIFGLDSPLNSLLMSLARSPFQFPNLQGLKALFPPLPDPSLILGLNSPLLSLARTSFLLLILTCFLKSLKRFETDLLFRRI